MARRSVIRAGAIIREVVLPGRPGIARAARVMGVRPLGRAPPASSGVLRDAEVPIGVIRPAGPYPRRAYAHPKDLRLAPGHPRVSGPPRERALLAAAAMAATPETVATHEAVIASEPVVAPETVATSETIATTIRRRRGDRPDRKARVARRKAKRPDPLLGGPPSVAPLKGAPVTHPLQAPPSECPSRPPSAQAALEATLRSAHPEGGRLLQLRGPSQGSYCCCCVMELVEAELLEWEWQGEWRLALLWAW